jgi:hypothetical protein
MRDDSATRLCGRGGLLRTWLPGAPSELRCLIRTAEADRLEPRSPERTAGYQTVRSASS